MPSSPFKVSKLAYAEKYETSLAKYDKLRENNKVSISNVFGQKSSFQIHYKILIIKVGSSEI